jgi:hypothetical protein
MSSEGRGKVRRARAALVLRGDSLHAWSRRRGYCDAYVHLALCGQRKGPKARRIVEELTSEVEGVVA